MLFLSLSVPLSVPNSKPMLLTPPSSRSILSTSGVASSSETLTRPRPLNCLLSNRTGKLGLGRRRSWIVRMAPDEEQLTRRSPLDFPVEWEKPRPVRRLDILPKFSPMKTPLPPPLPADPPHFDEEELEEDEEEEEKKEGDEEDPEEQEPSQ